MISDTYNYIFNVLDDAIVFNLIPLVVCLWFTHHFFNNRFNSTTALKMVSWFVVSYAVVTWSYNIIMLINNPNDFAIVKRSSGAYAAAYWIMFSLALIMPFSLLFKKLRKRFCYVLIVVFCMKIGYYFERFVLLITSIHRDYESPFTEMSLLTSMLSSIAIQIVIGFALAILLLVLSKFAKDLKIA